MHNTLFENRETAETVKRIAMHVHYVTMFQIHLLNHVPKIGNFGENIHVFLRHVLEKQ